MTPKTLKLDRRELLTGAAATAAAVATATVVATSGVVALPRPLLAASAGPLRVGSLKFGSLGWLLDTVIAEGLDKAHGFEIELLDMASTGASKIGLLSGSADVIVSDWPWAMRQRSEGEAVRFAPYSSALGSVMVAGDSPIQSVADLQGKRLGIAGSALDKSWLLLRAYAQQETGQDIAKSVSPIFGAAPLISEQIRQGRVDAALNFWTYSARLEGTGYRELVSMAQILKSMGIEPVPSLVGFIWDEKKSAAKSEAVEKFHSAIRAGNELLAKSDAPWERIKPSMRVQSDAEFDALKAYYRSGIPQGWNPAHTQSAEKLFGLLVKLGEKTLAGGKTKFDPALFHGA